MLEQLPENPNEVLDFIVKHCATSELKTKFGFAMRNVLATLKEFDMQTGTAEVRPTPNEVLPCYTLKFFNEKDKEGLCYCFPVRNGKIIEVAKGKPAPLSMLQ